MDKRKHIAGTVIIGGLMLILAAMNIFVESGEISKSEKRKLAAMPEFTLKTLVNGSFMQGFENYAMDHFLGREWFRTLKAGTQYYLMGIRDVHGIYLEDGSGIKILFPLNEKSLAHTQSRFQYLYDNYLKEKADRVYFAMVPDKGYYATSGRPGLDYATMENYFKYTMAYADWIDLTTTLDQDAYYRTDPHWKQEALVHTARHLITSMGGKTHILKDHRLENAKAAWMGAYGGQSGLPIQPDGLNYITSSVLEQAKVTDVYGDDLGGLYNMEKKDGMDPYEMFLSGSQPYIRIENKEGPKDRHLIVFRDSFGSSLVPLLTEAYSTITLIDIRYVNSRILGNYLDAEGADVLFLYSTLVLNDGFSLK